MSEPNSPSRSKLFLRVLEAELKDLLEDIQLVERKHKESYDRLNITQYVYLENTALLERERECFRALLKRILMLKVADYRGLDELSAAVAGEARSFVDCFEYPEAVMAFVERKLNKVRRYIDEPEE